MEEKGRKKDKERKEQKNRQKEAIEKPYREGKIAYTSNVRGERKIFFFINVFLFKTFRMISLLPTPFPFRNN